MGESKTAFLLAMTAGKGVPGRLPTWLLREATRAVRGLPGFVHPEDVEQAFLESLVLDGATSRARVLWHLLTDDAAAALVRRRMRQLACEMADGWNYHRALRSHVDAALQEGLPPAPAEPPYSLCDGDRLSRPLVARAAAWMVINDEACATTRNLTQKLKEHYSLQPMLAANDEPLDAADLDHDEPDEALEARRLAFALVESLGADEARLYGRRLGDHKLQHLGRESGLAVTTVHDRTKKAERIVQQVLVDSGCTPHVARSALRLLVQAVA